jgi:thiamine pyrophosphate-dependent acetolactate synthase large subunit-like protein
VNNQPATRDTAKAVARFDITQRLVAKLHHEEAVIGGIGHTNFDLWAAGRRPQNFYMLGSMGLAIPIALGVAIAQPARKVIALEGDGSLLMMLGCLATVGARQPQNLIMVIMDNGAYEITGGQATATSQGIASANWAADEAHFETLIDEALATPGPHLIAARLTSAKPAGQTERDPAQIRDRFMRGLGTKR